MPPFVASGKSTFGCLRDGLQIANPCAMDEALLYVDIGQRVEAVRTGFTDLTQNAFAVKMGFNRSQYNNWATGRRRIPLEAAEKLAALYGLTLDWIYLGRRDGLAESASKVV